jgi:hypothetical protein
LSAVAGVEAIRVDGFVPVEPTPSKATPSSKLATWRCLNCRLDRDHLMSVRTRFLLSSGIPHMTKIFDA